METNRFYRDWVESDLVGFEVRVLESDLFILADKALEKEAENSVLRYRKEIEDHIRMFPEFQMSLEPITFNEKQLNTFPEIIKSMLYASNKAGVGPMAGVAGAIAEFVGKDLLSLSNNIVVENGGDIFIKTVKDRQLGIYAGESSLSGKIALLIKAEDTPLGICTSSGTVGHSLSFGKADAVCVVAKDTTLSDAAATAICNRIKTKDDIVKGLNFSKTIEGIIGCVIIYQERIGSIGGIELV